MTTVTKSDLTRRRESMPHFASVPYEAQLYCIGFLFRMRELFRARLGQELRIYPVAGDRSCQVSPRMLDRYYCMKRDCNMEGRSFTNVHSTYTRQWRSNTITRCVKSVSRSVLCRRKAVSANTVYYEPADTLLLSYTAAPVKHTHFFL